MHNELIGGATVVTATARLARELRSQYDRGQLSDNHLAWESADILTWPAWLSRTWQQLLAMQPNLPVLLNTLQLTAVWEQIIRADIRNNEKEVAPLWNTRAAADTAAAAWRVVCEWQINLDQCANSPRRDHQCWLRWARQYKKLCIKSNWTDPYAIADRLIEILNQPTDSEYAKNYLIKLINSDQSKQIILAGFDVFTPQQKLLVDAFKLHTDIIINPPAKSINRRQVQYHFTTAQQEWLSAAQWVRKKLTENANTKLALVAPNLNQTAGQIERALNQIVSPRRLKSLESPVWHISVGKTLTDYPAVTGALTLLTPLASKPLASSEVSALLLNPFTHGGDSEKIARAKLELWCRRYLPYQISFKQLIKRLTTDVYAKKLTHVCPVLIKILRGAVALFDSRASALPSEWVSRFHNWLKHFGWPGERTLNSDEYQAAQALHNQLQQFAQLDLTCAPMSGGEALSRLMQTVGAQQFQIESRAESVQVLTPHEVTGQNFDGIWFGGLVDNDWPPPQHPNPFIATPLQRQAGVINASVERNFTQAGALQTRLIAAGREVVLSYPRYEDDVAVMSSALCTNAVAGKFDYQTAAEIIYRDNLDQGEPKLESINDSYAPPIKSGHAGGGISLIDNQAKCPFRGFAIHRLGARPPESNEQGLALTERGNLIHKALELTWHEINTSQKLHAMDDAKLQQIIFACAKRASDAFKVSSGCGDNFTAIQTEWLGELLTEWFATEKQRATEFTIHSIESDAELQLGELNLNFKIDRIDKLSDGTVAVLDYKTGVAEKKPNIGDVRMQSPQLLLYALAQTAPVAMVAFAMVKKGERKFIGAGRDDENWDELINHWRTELIKLAEQYTSGDARVLPLHNACDYCALPGFCRIKTEK